MPTRLAEAGFSPDVGINMDRLCAEYQSRVALRTAGLQKEILDIIGPPTERVSTETSRKGAVSDVVLASLFTRAVGMATALIDAMVTREQRNAARDATRGSHDIRELHKRLERLLTTE